MKAGKRAKRCVYCGAVTDGKACPAHRDLLRFDPMYAADLGEAAQALKGTGA